MFDALVSINAVREDCFMGYAILTTRNLLNTLIGLVKGMVCDA